MMAGATLTLMLSPGPRPQAKSWLLNYGAIHRWQEPLPIPRMPYPWGPPQLQVRHFMMNLVPSIMRHPSQQDHSRMLSVPMRLHLVSIIATLHAQTIPAAMTVGTGGPTK